MLYVSVSGIVARSTYAGLGTRDVDLNAYLQNDGRKVCFRWSRREVDHFAHIYLPSFYGVSKLPIASHYCSSKAPSVSHFFELLSSDFTVSSSGVPSHSYYFLQPLSLLGFSSSAVRYLPLGVMREHAPRQSLSQVSDILCRLVQL